MFSVHVQIGNGETNEWEKLSSWSLKTADELYPDRPELVLAGIETMGLDQEKVVLPNGEELEIGLSFSPSNRGLSFCVRKGDATLLNVGCFKGPVPGNDPSIVLLTPGGTHVSFMFQE